MFDCRTCGACCVADYEGSPFVSVDAADIARLSPHHRRLHVVDFQGRRVNGTGDYGSYLAVKEVKFGTTCVVLRGTVGKRVACGMYGQRPYACRVFEPGCKSCLRAREEAGVT